MFKQIVPSTRARDAKQISDHLNGGSDIQRQQSSPLNMINMATIENSCVMLAIRLRSLTLYHSLSPSELLDVPSRGTIEEGGVNAPWLGRVGRG